MSAKKIFEYNSDLIPQVDKIYFHKNFEVCLHDQICEDKRDHLFKCISCLKVFLFNKRDFKHFKNRITKSIDFKIAEDNLKKKIQISEEELEVYYDLY